VPVDPREYETVKEINDYFEKNPRLLKGRLRNLSFSQLIGLDPAPIGFKSTRNNSRKNYRIKENGSTITENSMMSLLKGYIYKNLGPKTVNYYNDNRNMNMNYGGGIKTKKARRHLRRTRRR
jgi:hypothetical protein